jgi:hypothetical protein
MTPPLENKARRIFVEKHMFGPIRSRTVARVTGFMNFPAIQKLGNISETV